MNPLVEQMLNATVSNDVETRLLEDLFERDCKCESDHDAGPDCTYDIVARKYVACDGIAFNICQSSLNQNRQWLSENGNCDGCNIPVSECWTIRPIWGRLMA